MIDFHYDKEIYNLTAERYEDLSKEQYLALNFAFCENYTEAELRMIALSILLNVGKVAFFRIPLDAKAAMLEHIDWVFEQPNTTKVLIDEYDELQAPADDFNNLTLKEWNIAEMHYKEYVVNKNESAINELVAVLYRPLKENYDKAIDIDGDCRIPFNANQCAYYAKAVGLWPKHIKMGIFVWYDSCRNNLTELYSDLFNGADTNGEEDADMFELIRGLCGNVYGSFEKVEQLNVHLALRDLELQKKEFETQQKNNPTT